MSRSFAKKGAWVGLGCVWLGIGFAACSAGDSSNGFTLGSGSEGNGGAGASGSGSGNHHGGTTVATFVTSGTGASHAGGGGPGCPSTCAALDADCGLVTDTICGGTIDCGGCTAPKTCGGGGVHYKCGTGNGDGCAPLSCADQHITCGQAGDGCTGSIDCGSCTLPQTCGGDPAKPGACGCTGTCAMVPTCPTGTTTTLTGKVLDPAGINPLYNALVYIPNNTTDAGLQPFAAGITCDVCGATAAGDPLVTANTAPDGTFTLTGVPVGGTIPLVVQLGRWRRQFTVNVANSCMPNSIADGTLTMPKNSGEGDIPRIGILTGGFDPVECVLKKMGVEVGEFTNPGGAGHINFYTAATPNLPPNPFRPIASSCPVNPYGSGAKIDANTPGQNILFGSASGTPTINQYDLVILACEGYEEDETGNWAALGAYTAAGGRVFSSDFAYGWLDNSRTRGQNIQNPAFPNVANWQPDQDPGGNPQTGVIDQVSNPKGAAFQQWLEIVRVSNPGSGQVSLNPVFHNSNSVVAPTQQWLYESGNNQPIHFTFNTPVAAQSADQCGRVVFSDWHADILDFSGNYPNCCGFDSLGNQLCGQAFLGPNTPPYYSHGHNFPTECDTNAMTPQEAILEFMLFDLTACVQPYVPLCTPTTCAAEGVQCGPAGDGCGNLLDCGMCPAGQFCGGGGAGKCGTSTTCTPETCMSQMIECGQAGDGCGHALNCGNCKTGEVCGALGPGKCGSVH